MSSRRLIIAAVTLPLAVGGFFGFRPDRAFTDRAVHESGPTGGMVARQGVFVPKAHEGKGIAEIATLEGGRRILRFRDFATLDGPDLKIYLTGDPEATTLAQLGTAGYLSLGDIKGNVGDQYYEIPADADLEKLSSVVVWCERFGVNFTSATLTAPMPMAS